MSYTSCRFRKKYFYVVSACGRYNFSFLYCRLNTNFAVLFINSDKRFNVNNYTSEESSLTKVLTNFVIKQSEK